MGELVVSGCQSLIYLLQHSVCCDILFKWKHVKKIQPHRDKQLEKGEDFRYGCSYWHCTKFPILISILKISNNVESKTMSMNLLYSVTLKSIGLSCILNRSFTHDSLSLCTSSNFWHISWHNIKFMNVTIKLIKTSTIENLWSSWLLIQVFQISSFHWKVQNLSLTQILLVGFLKGISSPYFWIHICQIL